MLAKVDLIAVRYSHAYLHSAELPLLPFFSHPDVASLDLDQT